MKWWAGEWSTARPCTTSSAPQCFRVASAGIAAPVHVYRGRTGGVLIYATSENRRLDTGPSLLGAVFKLRPVLIFGPTASRVTLKPRRFGLVESSNEHRRVSFVTVLCRPAVIRTKGLTEGDPRQVTDGSAPSDFAHGPAPRRRFRERGRCFYCRETIPPPES